MFGAKLGKGGTTCLVDDSGMKLRPVKGGATSPELEEIAVASTSLSSLVAVEVAAIVDGEIPLTTSPPLVRSTVEFKREVYGPLPSSLEIVCGVEVL